ncbi:carboxypeptidase-like regulatory domain-containing protein, partial [Bacteroides sp.]
MKKRFKLFLTCLIIGVGLVTAQTSKVTGVVISAEDGEPVVGASILVSGTTLGTVTDIDGKFTIINVP